MGLSRKADLVMTTPEHRGPRRLRAALIGFGLDDRDGPQRIITGKECLVLGGSEGAHDELLETLLRLEVELDRRGQTLGEIPPDELVEIAWRIDSPELQEIALRLESGLQKRGSTFHEASAEVLTELAAGCEP
jgi:hypothetical protein